MPKRRPKQNVRYIHSIAHVFIKGEPPIEIHPSLYTRDGDGYWLQLKKLVALDRERRQKEKEERRARRPLRGPGSGRAGGGRSAAHYRFHLKEGQINHDTKPEDCPICLNKRLWKLWLSTDYGQLPGWLAALLPQIPKVVPDKARPGEMKFTKVPKPHTREYLEVCDSAFDRYMRTHRYEHRTIKVNVAYWFEKPEYRYYTEYDIALSLGFTDRYDRPSTHEGIISTDSQQPALDTIAVHGGLISIGDRIERFDRLLNA